MYIPELLILADQYEDKGFNTIPLRLKIKRITQCNFYTTVSNYGKLRDFGDGTGNLSACSGNGYGKGFGNCFGYGNGYGKGFGNCFGYGDTCKTGSGGNKRGNGKGLGTYI